MKKTSPGLRRAILFLLLVYLAVGVSLGGETAPAPRDRETIIKAFLQEQPRFRAAGIFTSKVPGKPPVTCGARIHFDKDVGAVFSYNTTGEELEPYDFYFWNRTLALFVYNRERKDILKSEMQGAPLRTVFNFVWDILKEAEEGAGLKTLVFSGLMKMTLDESGDTIRIVFRKRLMPLPVKDITFVLNKDYQLAEMHLTESNGRAHSFAVQQFQKTTEKLKKPKIQKKPPARH